MADCPCNGAELVTPGHKMLCGSCGAEHVVTFPKNKAKVEELLSVRPVSNQNWGVHETESDLLAENISNGIGVF